jgi:ferric-dicitrate binding protein FerR (iron transport regulator)
MDTENDPIAALLQMAGRRPAVPPEVAARVREAVRDEWTRSTGRRTRTRWMAAAACVALVVTIALVALRTPQPSSPARAPHTVVARAETISGAAVGSGGRFLEPGAELRAGDTLETARSATASLMWGGATLRIDGNTHLRLESPRRLSLDRGAVYIATNGAGVVVVTPLGAIEDVGTQFEVRLDASAVRVRVRDGRVDLRRHGETHSPTAALELSAGAQGDVARRAVPRSGAEWDWVLRAAPAIPLEGRTLRSVVDAVSREKGLTPVYPERISDAHLHGNVPLSPDDALQAALAASGASAHVEGDRLIVRVRR